jgi:hypothetical protein
MKRFISILGLALGVSVSSYATLINNAGGAATGNLASAGAALITFDESTYPLGAFTSINFNVNSANSASNFQGSFSWLNTSPTGACTGAGTNCGTVYSSLPNGDLTNDKSLGNERLSNGNFSQPLGARSSYANILRITFTTNNVGEFGIVIRNNDAATSQGGTTVNTALNYMIVNFVGGGSTTQQALPNQFNNLNAANFFGWTANSGQQIASVDFVITGNDSSPNRILDIVTFDDVRIFANAAGTTTGGGGTTTSGGGGEIPEPSTYALMGAGLAALAYARRRK